MASKEAGKRARIGLACNACRLKKHRCSGEKPQCAQCVSTNVTCTWPTQQKRGPPKYYTNSLEVRLFETEAVLLSLLDHVSSEQLRASFQSMPPAARTYYDQDYEAEPSAEHLALLKQDVFKPAYWSSFPLDSEENVRRWWKDRVSRTSSGQGRNDLSSNLAPHEMEESGAQWNSFPEPGQVRFSHPTEQIDLDLPGPDSQVALIPLERVDGGDHLSMNIQSVPSTMRSEDELSTTNSEVSRTVLASDGKKGNVHITDQFKEDFLW